MGEVQVSILCIAYNHGKYIRQCLDGFVMQKEVSFEIIIHDDASTDDTADIIREYQGRYPHLVKPIFQKENQYSQGKRLMKEYMLPLVSGKYIALCEGDDYWVDPLKLKKQYDALESQSNCFMCGHKVKVVDESGGVTLKYQPNEDIQTGVLSSSDYFKNYSNTWGIHTSSFFFDSSKFMNYLNNKPKFAQVAPVGDICMLLYFAYMGDIFYIDEEMSHYRFMSVGSWTFQNSFSEEKEKRRELISRKMRLLYLEFCNYSQGKYRDELDFKIRQYNADEFYYLLRDKDYRGLFSTFTKEELQEYGLTNKDFLKMRMSIMFPELMKIYEKLK